MESYRTRSVLAILGVVLAIVWVMPNLVNFSENSWWFSKSKLNYGLDIQGGLHLVMGVDVEGVIGESATRMLGSIKAELAKEQIAVNDATVTKASEGQMTFTYAAGTKDKLEKFISEKYGTALQVISSNETSLVARFFDSYLNDYKTKVIHQAIETIRNRIDEFGVSEPSISQQGANRILVQLPGMADAEKAKALINTTAKLDFMIVSNEKSQADLVAMIAEAEKAGGYNLQNTKYSEYVTKLNKDLASKIPAKTAIYFSKSDNAQNMQNGALPYLLKTDSGLDGSSLNDSSVTFGQYGEPEVDLKFNSVGAGKFADLTGANVGRQMAVVLDKVVKTAPNLKERIGGGSARITLGGGRDRQKMMDEAKMISTSLRAGALPASLEQLEERRVGPTLGADSINKAKMASFVGAALIVLFMLVYYKAMGVLATVCLGINVLSVFALLTSLGATLTLPGIAGIALSVGVAVDANVLINERIKEELHHGGSWKIAIQEGYSRAMSAILDSNMTTAATAVILLYFGTGPVRGFAVTLLIGIVTTLFANVFVSKVLVDTLINKWGIKKLSV